MDWLIFGIVAVIAIIVIGAVVSTVRNKGGDSSSGNSSSGCGGSGCASDSCSTSCGSGCGGGD